MCAPLFCCENQENSLIAHKFYNVNALAAIRRQQTPEAIQQIAMPHPMTEQRHRQQEERRNRHDHQRAIPAVPARRIEFEQVRKHIHRDDGQRG